MSESEGEYKCEARGGSADSLGGGRGRKGLRCEDYTGEGGGNRSGRAGSSANRGSAPGGGGKGVGRRKCDSSHEGLGVALETIDA